MRIGSLAFLLHNAVDYAVYIPQVAIAWIALCACAMPAIMPETKPRLPPWRAFLQGMFIVFCCGLAFCLALVCAGERAIEQGVMRLYAGSLSDACRHWQRASRIIPWSDTPYYLLAECAARDPLPHVSPVVLYYYQQAIQRNPRYAFYYSYVAHYLARHGEKERALEFLTKARAAYPHNEQFERAAHQLLIPSSSD
jgi:tetratricopeptide (TPR) repeat protein